MTWLKKIDPLEVMLYATPVQLMDFDPKYTIDDVAQLMIRGGVQIMASQKPPPDPATDPRPPAEFWPQVKREFFVLLCTNDARYADLRAKLSDVTKGSTAAVISMLSAAIATHMSTAAGSIVGLVAVCLYGVLRIGKESYCTLYR